MNKIPIGNTLEVCWRIKHGGQDESLEGLDLVLLMTTPSGHQQQMPFIISDLNLITMRFEGSEQELLGGYRLDLYENRDLESQYRIDSAPAFILVPHTADGRRESDPNLEVYTVELEGNIEVGTPSNAVTFTPQLLSVGQQRQARANINAKRAGYTRIEKLHDYIHEIWYDGVDYSFADLLPHTPLGGCTSIRKGKFFARNLDWQYGECCEFFIHTPAANGRHAVDGFGGNIPALTKSVVESGEWNAAYNWLPLSIADGHNDAGLCASMNVVPTKTAPNTYEKTTGTNPGKPTLNGLMIVRYILDNHTDALAAAEDIRDNWNVVMPHTESFDEELHFLIADKTKTIVLEFVGNEAKIIVEGQNSYITNFRLYGTSLHEGGSIDRDTVEPFGQGFERFSRIEQYYQWPSTLTEFQSFIKTLWFTNAYVYEWLTEFTGINDDLTIQSAYNTPFYFIDVIRSAKEKYQSRTRNGETWQTTHSVVYDIESGECLFLVQQDESTLTRRDMALPIDAYTKSETDALLEGKADKSDIYTKSEVDTALDGKVGKVFESPLSGLKFTHYTNATSVGVEVERNGEMIHTLSVGMNGVYADEDKVATASDLAGKQGTISDLSAIREGASAGATALQPTDLPDFGDIVTHDADEFATAEQGEKAATAIQYIPQQLTEAQKEQARENIADTTRRPFGRNMYPEEFVYRDGSHALNADGTWKSGSSTFIFKITKKHDRVRETYNRAFICEGWNETGLVNPVAFSAIKELTQEDVGKYIAVCHTSGYSGPMFSVYAENVWFEDDLTSDEIAKELEVIHSLYRPREYRVNAYTAAQSTFRVSPLIGLHSNQIRHLMSGCDDEQGNQAWVYATEVVKDMQYINQCNLVLHNYVQRYPTTGVTSLYDAFAGCKYLERADLSLLDTSLVTSMSYMFSGCSSLTTLDVSGWDVGAVTNMQSMFSGCSSLATLDVSGWDVGSVTNMYGMFNGCSSLTTLDVSGWDVGAVTSMYGMFNGCSSLTTLDVSGWDVGAVTSMQNMFNGCSSLTTLDVSGWDVGAVTNMQSMFYGCSSLTTLIGGSQDLTKVALGGTNVTLVLSQSTRLDRASLRAVINGLADRTGQSQLTLTLGNTLKAKLTDEDILVATDKNWRIA